RETWRRSAASPPTGKLQPSPGAVVIDFSLTAERVAGGVPVATARGRPGRNRGKSGRPGGSVRGRPPGGRVQVDIPASGTTRRHGACVLRPQDSSARQRSTGPKRLRPW